jgi:hypothetical protein
MLHLVVFLLPLIAGCGGTETKTGATAYKKQPHVDKNTDVGYQPPPTVARPATTKADFSVTASGLWSEYYQNADQTIAKYQGKVIEVSGTINQVATNPNGQPVIHLQAGGGLGLMCIFHLEDEDFAEKYGRGQAVRIKGVWNPGARTLALSDCVVVGR